MTMELTAGVRRRRRRRVVFKSLLNITFRTYVRVTYIIIIYYIIASYTIIIIVFDRVYDFPYLVYRFGDNNRKAAPADARATYTDNRYRISFFFFFHFLIVRFVL